MKKLIRSLVFICGTLLIATCLAGVMELSAMGKVYAYGTVRSFAPTDELDGDYGYQDLARRSNGVARQEFYNMLKEAAEEFSESTEDLTSNVVAEINVASLGLSAQELAETYYVMYYDNPQYYWMSNTFSLEGVVVPFSICEEYREYSTRYKYDKMLNETLQKYDALVYGMDTCYDVALAIHDKLIRDIEYAYQPNSNVPSTEAYAHSIIGVIDDDKGEAVCEGYAKMYQLLLNRYGIDNILVCGIGNGDNHAWNLVQMDYGNYYCTDVTWDDTNVALENGVDIISYQYFNASSIDFDVLHASYHSDDNIIYYTVLPETSVDYDYTFYANNKGLIDDNIISYCANTVDPPTDLDILIIDAIKEAYAKGDNTIYLFSYGSGVSYMAMYNGVIEKIVGRAASTIEETALCGYTMHTLSDECIVEFQILPDREKAISLYQGDVLLGEYVTLDGAFSQMTDVNGNYLLSFNSETHFGHYIAPIYSELPQVGSIVFSGGKKDVNGMFWFNTHIYLCDDLKITGNITFDFTNIGGEDLYFSNATVSLSNYSDLGNISSNTNIYTDNVHIIVLPEGDGGCEIASNLYGDCDITLIGRSLSIRKNSEIDTLTIKTYRSEENTYYNGNVRFSGSESAEEYYYHTVNRVISTYSPFDFSGNNLHVTIGELEMENGLFSIFFANISKGNLLPKINIGKMTGVERINVKYNLSTYYLWTDSNGQEVGSGVETCDKSILKNNEGLFLTCPNIDVSQINASYSSSVENGDLNVVQIGDKFYVKIPGECEANGHSVVTDAAVSPTCTAPGLTEGSHCSGCGIVLNAQTEVPAIGHTETMIPGKAATCVEDGLKEGICCSVCGVVLKTQDVIPLTGQHTYDDHQDADCGVCGYTRDVTMITTPMYRLYNANSGEHFYTGSVGERDNLITAGWQYEGIAWNAPVTAGMPVHRMYNPNSGDHHYTMSLEEVDMLEGAGWAYEGVCWNSASPDALPLYRLYNPNADCGSHHYTGSAEERDMLTSVGWHFEGIGWFGLQR